MVSLFCCMIPCHVGANIRVPAVGSAIWMEKNGTRNYRRWASKEPEDGCVHCFSVVASGDGHLHSRKRWSNSDSSLIFALSTVPAQRFTLRPLAAKKVMLEAGSEEASQKEPTNEATHFFWIGLPAVALTLSAVFGGQPADADFRPIALAQVGAQMEVISDSATSVEAILAKQLARRFREMSDEELVDILQQLLKASMSSSSSQNAVDNRIGPEDLHIQIPKRQSEIKTGENIPEEVRVPGTQDIDADPRKELKDKNTSSETQQANVQDQKQTREKMGSEAILPQTERTQVQVSKRRTTEKVQGNGLEPQGQPLLDDKKNAGKIPNGTLLSENQELLNKIYSASTEPPTAEENPGDVSVSSKSDLSDASGRTGAAELSSSKTDDHVKEEPREDEDLTELLWAEWSRRAGGQVEQEPQTSITSFKVAEFGKDVISKIAAFTALQKTVGVVSIWSCFVVLAFFLGRSRATSRRDIPKSKEGLMNSKEDRNSRFVSSRGRTRGDAQPESATLSKDSEFFQDSGNGLIEFILSNEVLMSDKEDRNSRVVYSRGRIRGDAEPESATLSNDSDFCQDPGNGPKEFIPSKEAPMNNKEDRNSRAVSFSGSSRGDLEPESAPLSKDSDFLQGVFIPSEEALMNNKEDGNSRVISFLGKTRGDSEPESATSSKDSDFFQDSGNGLKELISNGKRMLNTSKREEHYEKDIFPGEGESSMKEPENRKWWMTPWGESFLSDIKETSARKTQGTVARVPRRSILGDRGQDLNHLSNSSSTRTGSGSTSSAGREDDLNFVISTEPKQLQGDFDGDVPAGGSIRPFYPLRASVKSVDINHSQLQAAGGQPGHGRFQNLWQAIWRSATVKEASNYYSSSEQWEQREPSSSAAEDVNPMAERPIIDSSEDMHFDYGSPISSKGAVNSAKTRVLATNLVFQKPPSRQNSINPQKQVDGDQEKKASRVVRDIDFNEEVPQKNGLGGVIAKQHEASEVGDSAASQSNSELNAFVHDHVLWVRDDDGIFIQQAAAMEGGEGIKHRTFSVGEKDMTESTQPSDATRDRREAGSISLPTPAGSVKQRKRPVTGFDYRRLIIDSRDKFSHNDQQGLARESEPVRPRPQMWPLGYGSGKQKGIATSNK